MVNKFSLLTLSFLFLKKKVMNVEAVDLFFKENNLSWFEVVVTDEKSTLLHHVVAEDLKLVEKVWNKGKGMCSIRQLGLMELPRLTHQSFLQKEQSELLNKLNLLGAKLGNRVSVTAIDEKDNNDSNTRESVAKFGLWQAETVSWGNSFGNIIVVCNSVDAARECALNYFQTVLGPANIGGDIRLGFALSPRTMIITNKEEREKELTNCKFIMQSLTKTLADSNKKLETLESEIVRRTAKISATKVQIKQLAENISSLQ
jgi:hypothetical protein